MNSEVRIKVKMTNGHKRQNKKTKLMAEPTQEEIDQAIKEFTMNGGQVKKLEPFYLDDSDHIY
ncbi:MAG: hypothetical protein OEY59_02800 [Deltaproteobacteria bacterium]|nr:hypothetical protein [Deltaproteobacteria bacterium]